MPETRTMFSSIWGGAGSHRGSDRSRGLARCCRCRECGERERARGREKPCIFIFRGDRGRKAAFWFGRHATRIHPTTAGLIFSQTVMARLQESTSRTDLQTKLAVTLIATRLRLLSKSPLFFFLPNLRISVLECMNFRRWLFCRCVVDEQEVFVACDRRRNGTLRCQRL